MRGAHEGRTMKANLVRNLRAGPSLEDLVASRAHGLEALRGSHDHLVAKARHAHREHVAVRSSQALEVGVRIPDLLDHLHQRGLARAGWQDGFHGVLQQS